ncbi:hypothetical protein F7731_14590 [Cytobacillus depressus]|uniref:Uncharacterized protein n=1 Tax=Cytobacillus depressus TaxID=1602942 RepID=A0A6L3V3B3_9BACI|nr:hypothetical protein [Cytobacillus depressus]KAB2334440.1 hypothetical protein F7731_14590 [Cytobacillus depressus]
MKKKLFGILLLAFIALTIFVINVDAFKVKSQPNEASVKETTVEVLRSAWDEYGMFSFEIVETDSIISIGMDKAKSEFKLQDYLDKNLPEEAKSKYNIKIFKKDIKELEKEHREVIEKALIRKDKEEN